jgi:hypothetical protein
MATKQVSRLWLVCWRSGLLFLGLAGLLVTATGLFFVGSSLFGTYSTKAGELWFFLFITAFGLLPVAIAVKGWPMRSRADIVETEAAFRRRFERLENWMNR